MTLPISTERLTLRRFTEGDTQDHLACVAHASFASATPEIEATEAVGRKYIEMQIGYRPFELGRCFDLAVERRADGRVSGLVSLVRDEHEQGAHRVCLGDRPPRSGVRHGVARAGRSPCCRGGVRMALDRGALTDAIRR
jgi:hypothetical protein